MSLPDYYKRLEQAIGQYKSTVDETLVELRRPLIIDLAFIVVIPVILVIIAAIFSNIAGILTTLGLGGINAEERLRRGQTVLKSYWGDSSKLRKSVKRLEFELLLCEPSNTTELQKIENLLRDYFDALP